MPDIFLSYNRDDAATARRFAEGLERQKFSVWWDATLRSGEDYDQVTEDALRAARAVIVLWSSKSVVSRWVRTEAAVAQQNKTLMPVMIEPCQRPIMFELTHTADLSLWKGNGDDPAWLAFVADVRRLVDRGGQADQSPRSPDARTAESLSTVHWLRRPETVVAAVALLAITAAGFAYLQVRRDVPRVQNVASAPVAGIGVSLAVLPFVNMSSDKEQEYFSDGLSEELLNQLAQAPDLRVIGRTSSFAFKGKSEDLRHIGEVLGVDHILEGSVRKAGNRVLITAQLISSADGSHLWSATYERTLDDIFAIQEEIARTVARELQVRLGTGTSNVAGTKNVAAFDEFLAGRALLNSYSPGSIATAVQHLERAIELDATFVPARLWLIDAYARNGIGIPERRQQLVRKQDDAIDQVVKTAPDSPEASMALSYRADREFDRLRQEQFLKGALKVGGGLGNLALQNYQSFLLSVAQITSVLSGIERARQDDPLNIFARTNHLLFYELAGDYTRADEEMQQLLLLPGGASPPLLATAVTRAAAQHDEGKLRKALAALVASTGGATSLESQLGGVLDDPARARGIVRTFAKDALRNGELFEEGSVSAWAGYFGDKALVLQALAAIREHGHGFFRSAWELWRPVLKNLRNDAEFKAELRKWGLVDYWRATGNWGDFCKPAGKDDFECH